MRTRYGLAAALAAALLLVPAAGPASAAGCGLVPRGQPAWASLARAVAVVASGGTAGGSGEVEVAEGAAGFPVVVTTAGATGTAGAVPAGTCIALAVRGQQVATGRASERGRFALAATVPRGAVATVRWAPCAGSTDQRDCHNRVAHQHNPNKDEARSGGQGCSGAGDAGPRS